MLALLMGLYSSENSRVHRIRKSEKLFLVAIRTVEIAKATSSGTNLPWSQLD